MFLDIYIKTIRPKAKYLISGMTMYELSRYKAVQQPKQLTTQVNITDFRQRTKEWAILFYIISLCQMKWDEKEKLLVIFFFSCHY